MDDTMPILHGAGPRLLVADICPRDAGRLWRVRPGDGGPTTSADDNMGAIARRIPRRGAARRFALAGHFHGRLHRLRESCARAADRVAKLALINTQAMSGRAGGERAPPRP